jgi:cathepsin L
VSGSYSTSIGAYWRGEYGTPEEIMTAVDIRPAAVGLNASGYRFQTYETGVLSNCSNTSMNHAVVMDGYSTTATTPYFQVRNSWGSGWGLDGYILLAMEDGNVKGQCGV